jgi:hypothetical protein
LIAPFVGIKVIDLAITGLGFGLTERRCNNDTRKPADAGSAAHAAVRTDG